jgi:hypothetical protein
MYVSYLIGKWISDARMKIRLSTACKSAVGDDIFLVGADSMEQIQSLLILDDEDIRKILTHI